MRRPKENGMAVPTMNRKSGITRSQARSEERLRTHVFQLADTIGERNAYKAGTMERSAQYIDVYKRQEQYVHTGENWSLISSEDYQYDAELKLAKTTRGNEMCIRDRYRGLSPKGRDVLSMINRARRIRAAASPEDRDMSARPLKS